MAEKLVDISNRAALESEREESTNKDIEKNIGSIDKSIYYPGENILPFVRSSIDETNLTLKKWG